MEFNTIFTQASLATCLRYPLAEGPVIVVPPKKKKKKIPSKVSVPPLPETQKLKPSSPLVIRSSSKAKERNTYEVPLEKAFKTLRKPTAQPSPSKLFEHPWKSRAYKGKNKTEDVCPKIPIVARPLSTLKVADKPEEALLPKKRKLADQAKLKAGRSKPEVIEVSPKESLRVEQPEVVPEAPTDVVSVALKMTFVNVLIGSRKFVVKKSTIHEMLLDGRPIREVTVSPEDCDPLAIAPLSTIPLPPSPIKVTQLSDFDKDDD
jgi:hypothetical protein